MQLESVRELKQVLPMKLARRFAIVSDRRVAGARVAIARAAAVTSTLPNYALGVAPGRTGDFRLAIRLQHRGLERSELVTAMREAAKGEIDVRYIGRVTAGARTRRSIPWYQKRHRPVLIGTSCGYVADYLMAGTVGAFVRRKTASAPMLLSNNHVLADEGRYKVGDPILQPGSLDGGQNPADRIASLASFVRLRKRPAKNYVDAAVATVEDSTAIDPRRLKGLGNLSGVMALPLDVNERVHKVGRTTGLRHGRVTAIEIDGVDVEYEIGVLRFENQVEIEGRGAQAFSDAGDSGSVIVNDDLLAGALLFAGSDEGGTNGRGLTYANPIKAVLSRMRLELLV